MSAIAHEMSRRMTADYAKERARDMARDSATQMRERALDNPMLLQVLGAGLGALATRAILPLLRQSRDRSARSYDLDLDERYREPFGRGFSGELRGGEQETDLGDRAADVKDRASAKAGEYADRVREQAARIRERIPSAGEVKARASDQLAFWAVGAIALGALLGLVVPVTEQERRVLEPAKEKMRDMEDQALEKARALGEKTIDRAVGAAVSAATGSPSEERGEEEQRREPEPPPAIH